MSRWIDRALRRLAALIVRGPDARYILGDLDETLERDRAAAPWRARRRYAVNAVSSALSVGRTRLGSALGALSSLGFSWLDVKLGLRMLVKYPGLTLVAVFALSLGIPASLVPIHFLGLFQGTLPFDEGERIVGIRHYRTDALAESPGSIQEYEAWRDGLSSFDAIGAAYSRRFNVIAEDGRVRAYRGAFVTASAFGIVRVRPMLGRPLIADDELSGAPDVVVLGYEAWQTLLDGDARAVGRVVRIGSVPHVVVGVMPEGFLFPLHEHVWLPLRAAEVASPWAGGPDLWIFGRLADGVTERRAQAEATAFDTGLKAAFPDLPAQVRAEVVSFSTLLTGNPAALFWLIAPVQLFALLLLAVACGNVGTLVFARTVARSGEVAVRTALGANRGRIVSQLFAESLVLALLATGVGLLLADFAAQQFGRLFVGEDSLPFWIDFRLKRRTMALALALAVFCAVIAGVLPALRATGRGIHGSLQRTGVGRGGIGFGPVTTVLIVTEVALGVVCLFVGAVGYRATLWNASPAMDIRPEQFLTAAMRLSEPGSASADVELDAGTLRARAARFQDELVRRLEAEPGVQGVALTGTLPGQGHNGMTLEVEGEAAGLGGEAGHPVASARVDVGYFEGLGHAVLQGRDFVASDLPAGPEGKSPVVIVNTTFVERVLHGGNPIGRRVRSPAKGDQPAGPWQEIVGVVGHLGTIDSDPLPDDAGLYQPVAPGELQPVHMLIRLMGDPSAFAPRLRQLSAAVDPAVIVEDPLPLLGLESTDAPFFRWTLFGLAVVAGIAVVLSVAGLYALLSFTVAQRTREIGVRTALGASTARIMLVVARRAALQLAMGLVVGAIVVGVVVIQLDPFGPMDPSLTPLQGWPLTLAAAGGFIVVAATVACIAPTLRGLRIKPMDAMRI